MAECWICLRTSFEEGDQARELQLSCGHHFHEACLLEVQEVSASSSCPACSEDGRWSATGLCRAAAVEYLRAVRSTAPETPARFVVSQRCWGYLHDALALDANHSKSMVLAGVLYQAGIGVERDDGQAFEHFNRAHAAGDALGTLHLARCHKKGTKVCGQDTYRARQLFTEADAAGNTMATLELALMCRSGLGGEKDMSKAMELFQKADASGDALAAFELGKAYLNGSVFPKDGVKARMHMEAAHSRGYTLATVELGQMYLSGIGGPQDVALGQELLMAVDFPAPKPTLDQKSLNEGWVNHTAMELYRSDIERLNKDEWWQLKEPEEPEEEDPNAMLKAAGLYIERTQPVAAGPFASQEVIPPPGCGGGGMWRATTTHGSVRFGDPMPVSEEQARLAKGRRAVVDLQDGFSVIAEYVLPHEYDGFMRRAQDVDADAAGPVSCTPFGMLSNRLRRFVKRKT